MISSIFIDSQPFQVKGDSRIKFTPDIPKLGYDSCHLEIDGAAVIRELAAIVTLKSPVNPRCVSLEGMIWQTGFHTRIQKD